ncbi:MAG: primosomal protein N' [Verrucomicrobiae bacterium]|nr:primosomal protein N' [Verrucomicrobiae bacterium]
MKVARVLTEVAMDRALDYEVPESLCAAIQLGHRVKVPLGRRLTVGYVVAFPEVAQVNMLKPIQDLVDKEPLIQPRLIELAQWMAEYYVCSLETALKTLLPEAVRNIEISYRELFEVRLLKSILNEDFEQLKQRAKKQAHVLESLAKVEGALLVAKAEKELGASWAMLRSLEKKGWVTLTRVRQERDPFSSEDFLVSQDLVLNEEQAQVFEQLKKFLNEKNPKPFLIHGVTGSGKTELYLQAMRVCLEQGRGAIMLVPEIALTPQSVERLKSRFAAEDGTEVAVLHSHLSSGERHDEWHRIREGRARVVIGARSAVFAPVKNLGMIVVDEEHEGSYKQQEAPRYHARDVAIMRGRLEGALVVLGSATPAVETYYHAQTKKYELAELKKRVDEQAMPTMHVVDMRQEVARGKGIPVLSNRLYEAIYSRLEKKEQVILFLNRRGFSSSLICVACGYVAMCPNCSVALTFHRAQGKVRCHWCDHTEEPPHVCPQCHDPRIRYAGLGTERVEEVILSAFPQAVVQRMDSDTMRRKGAHQRVLGDFKRGKIDILVGTQMIAKGLHFPNVTLVGIVYADLALHLPDFRASERVFQLLTQVAGRAGRGNVKGDVVVQSFTPFVPAIQFSKHYDFQGFYEQELEFRREFHYPPFCRCTLLTVRSRSEERASFFATYLEKELRALALPKTTVSQAAPAPMAKIQGWYRYQILIRTMQPLIMGKMLKNFLSELTFPEEIMVIVDVDAVQLL